MPTNHDSGPKEPPADEIEENQETPEVAVETPDAADEEQKEYFDLVDEVAELLKRGEELKRSVQDAEFALTSTVSRQGNYRAESNAKLAVTRAEENLQIVVDRSAEVDKRIGKLGWLDRNVLKRDEFADLAAERAKLGRLIDSNTQELEKRRARLTSEQKNPDAVNKALATARLEAAQRDLDAHQLRAAGKKQELQVEYAHRHDIPGKPPSAEAIVEEERNRGR